MSNADNKPKLRVAIIGAGPAGLGAAIEFQKLPFVDLHIYEQARELREVGAGISIQRNTWRMLDALGVYDNIDRDSVFSAADGHSVQHRLVDLPLHSNNSNENQQWPNGRITSVQWTTGHAPSA